MKRALLGTLWIGALAAAVAIGLQMSGLLARPATALAHAIGLSPKGAVVYENYVFVMLLSFAVAWAILQVAGWGRQLGLFSAILLELLGAAWLLQAGKISFPPLPAMVATATATLLALAVHASAPGRKRRVAARSFAGRLGQEGLDRLTESEPPDLTKPSAQEATFVFCEIANEADLIDELSPSTCAELTREFIEGASGHFLKSGGYLQAADGEGVRILFGFPNASPDHAAEAARAALAFCDDFRARAADQPDSLGQIDLRLGISSGVIVAAKREDSPRDEIVIAGEPLEVARRLARANQVYGSQILLDPRAFNAAGKAIVARPIDFLRSAAAHDRLEVYELLALAEKATPDQIARRDCFWTAIVYFRERRWNEAFAEFNRARANDGELDPPLQWYLRRLEPLCLRMATEPAPAGDPLIPL